MPPANVSDDFRRPPGCAFRRHPRYSICQNSTTNITPRIAEDPSAHHMSETGWEITGTISVEENLTTRDALGQPLLRRRALGGIAVRVSTQKPEDESLRIAGEALTDRDGRFRLRAAGAPLACRSRLLISLAGTQLTVTDAAPVWWLAALEMPVGMTGTFMDVGALTLREGAAGELGERDNVRRAVTWYVARAAMEFLSGLAAGLSFTQPITVSYPAVSRTGASYACRITRTAIIHRDAARDDWSVERVLRQVMRLWSSQCEGARSFWPPEQVGRSDSTGSADDRFAELAANELMTLLWNSPISR